MDTECVRAFREGGESAELSTMSPASTSHQSTSASQGLPRATSIQRGWGCGVTRKWEPTRARPVGAGWAGRMLSLTI